jgi:hypothetical protein
MPVKLYFVSPLGDIWKNGMSKRSAWKNGGVASAFIVTRPDTQQTACVSKEDEYGRKIMFSSYDLGWISTINNYNVR